MSIPEIKAAAEEICEHLAGFIPASEKRGNWIVFSASGIPITSAGNIQAIITRHLTPAGQSVRPEIAVMKELVKVCRSALRVFRHESASAWACDVESDLLDALYHAEEVTKPHEEVRPEIAVLREACQAIVITMEAVAKLHPEDSCWPAVVAVLKGALTRSEKVSKLSSKEKNVHPETTTRET